MRSLTIEHFGVTRVEEKQAVLLTLTNANGMRVELLNYGATVRSISVQDRDGIFRDVVLGYDMLEEYEEDTLYMGGVVGRVAGRIAKAEFALDSREYILAANDPPHHFNGGSKSPLSKKVWDYCLMEEGNGVTFSVRSHDGEEGYPGNLLVHGVSSIDDHELTVHMSSYIPIDFERCPTGSVATIQPSSSRDFSAPRMVDAEDMDVVFCQDPTATKAAKRFRQVARMSSRTSGIDLHITSSHPCVHFNTGTSLNGGRGKEGREHRRHGAFLLRCRGFEDAIHQPSFPSVVLRPDELYQHITIFRFALIE